MPRNLLVLAALLAALACSNSEARKPAATVNASTALPTKLEEVDRQALYISVLELQQLYSACQAQPAFVQAQQARNRLLADLSARYRFKLPEGRDPGDDVDLKTGDIKRRQR